MVAWCVRRYGEGGPPKFHSEVRLILTPKQHEGVLIWPVVLRGGSR